MGKIYNDSGGREISPHTLFHQYSGKENQLTKALLHVIDELGPDFLMELSAYLNIDIPDSYFSVKTQMALKEKNEKDDYSTIDGIVTISPIQFLIESKLPREAINLDQLDRHRDRAQHNGQHIPTVLLYVTPDESKPKALGEYEDVSWISWVAIRDLINQFYDKKNKDSIIRNAFNGYFDFVFSGNTRILKEEFVVILAGSYAEPLALKEGIYHCQPWRSFKGASYIAFYNEKQISHVFKIVNNYKSKKEITDEEFLKKLDFLKTDDQIFELRKIEGIIEKPIKNDKKDRNGNITAFTMGQPRYFSISQLRKAKVTSDLEKQSN